MDKVGNMVVPHLELLDNHVQKMRKLVITSTVCMVLLNGTIAGSFLLAWASMRKSFDTHEDQNRVLSERIDRNFLVLKEMREATVKHCRIVHGVDLDREPPDAGHQGTQ